MNLDQKVRKCSNEEGGGKGKAYSSPWKNLSDRG